MRYALHIHDAFSVLNLHVTGVDPVATFPEISMHASGATKYNKTKTSPLLFIYWPHRVFLLQGAPWEVNVVSVEFTGTSLDAGRAGNTIVLSIIVRARFRTLKGLLFTSVPPLFPPILIFMKYYHVE